MSTATVSINTIHERLRKLGLPTDDLPRDRMCSATSALCCLPMYMVANTPAWMENEQRRTKISRLLGIDALRESFAIGQEEARFDISSEHGRTLHQLLIAARQTDVIVYEYALKTLAMFLEDAADDLIETIKMLVARGMVAVATAAGESSFGAGEEPSPSQRDCIRQVVFVLKLNDSPSASATLDELDL